MFFLLTFRESIYKNRLNKIKEIGKTVDREKLIYRRNEYIESFENFPIINTFGRDIYNGIVTLKEANEDQSDSLIEILNFEKQIKRQNPEKKQKKKVFLKTYMHFLMVEKEFLMLLKAKYF